MKYIHKLEALGACPEALDWLRAEKHPTLAAAWVACPRGDWMLWLIGHLSGRVGDPRRLQMAPALCECAGLALYYYSSPELVGVVELIQAWTRGDADADALRALIDEKHRDLPEGVGITRASVIFVARAVLEAGGVGGTPCAREVGIHAGFVASLASSAAHSFSNVPENETLSICADIVRKYYPEPPALPLPQGWAEETQA